MSLLEKFLLAATALLIVAAIVILMMPDASGKTGLEWLSPYLKKIGASASSLITQFNASLGSVNPVIKAPARNSSPAARGLQRQSNPIDSAVAPAASYGEAQKDMFGKPIQGIQR